MRLRPYILASALTVVVASAMGVSTSECHAESEADKAPGSHVGGDLSEPKVVEPTASQLALYESASVAFAEGRYHDAIEALSKALEEGEVNIFYVNLGRALFRTGQCVEAKAAYDAAQESRYVAEPTREQVQKKILEFRAELEERCAGEIMAACTPDALRVSIDDNPVRPCAEGPFAVMPGSHLVSAHYQGRKVVKEVTIYAMKRTGVVLDLAPPATYDPSTAWKSAGYVTAGIGVVLLAGSAFFDLVLVRRAVEEYDEDHTDADARAEAANLQSVVLGTTLAGGLMTVTGLMFVLLAPSSSEEPTAGSVGTGVWLDGSGGGVSWSTPF